MTPVGRDLDNVDDRLAVGAPVVDIRRLAPGDAAVGRGRKRGRTEAHEVRRRLIDPPPITAAAEIDPPGSTARL